MFASTSSALSPTTTSAAPLSHPPHKPVAKLAQGRSRFGSLPFVLLTALTALGGSGCSDSAPPHEPLDGSTGGAGGAGSAAATDDSFDLEGAYPEQLVRAGGDHDGIQYYGRWDFSNAAVPTASWGAVYLEVGFEGTGLTLHLNNAQADYVYRVDDGELHRLSPSSGDSALLLAEGLKHEKHRVSFYRLSGGSFGLTRIKGVDVHSDDGSGALFALPRWKRQLEFLGDSISVGYGVDGTGGTSRATENGYLAYGPQTARELGAAWSVVAHSGQGMVRNLGEDKTQLASGEHMDDQFLRTHFPSAGINRAWDFAEAPDALIVMLGTNDFAWPVWNKDPGPDYELTEAEYVDGYSAFLHKVRELYPTTHVFAVGTLLGTTSNQFGRCNNYICSAVSAQNDEKMHCIDPSAQSGSAWLSSGSDYIGDWTHPTADGNAKIASQLAPLIADALGW